MRAILVAASSCLLLLPAEVASAEEKPVSMREFLERAARADVAVLEVDANVARARAELRSRALLGNPVVSLEREDAGMREETIEAGISLAPRRFADRASARADWRAADTERAWRRASALLDAAELFLGAARARLRVTALRDARDAFAPILEKARARARAGDSSTLDADRLSLEMAAMDATLADAEAELSAALRSLAVLAGEDVVPNDDLAASAVPPEDTRGGDHPLVTGAELRARAASRALLAGRLAWLPEFSVHGGTKTSGEEAGWIAGGSLSIPLFDRGQGDRTRAAAELALADAQLERRRREIPALLATSRAALVRRVDQARAYEAVASSAPDIVRRTEAAWRDGARPLSDLIDAHEAALGARLRIVDLRHAARIAELDFHRSRGTTP